MAGFFTTFVLPMLIILPLPLFGLGFALLSMGKFSELRDETLLLSALSAALLASSVGAMVFVAACVGLSSFSQRVQVIGFQISWGLLRPICLFQVIGQGVLAVALSYYVTAVLIGYIWIKIILLIGISVLVAIWNCVVAIFRVPEMNNELDGRRLDAAQLGPLMERLERICKAMDQRVPENVVVGIDDNFFVTEAPITVGGHKFRGRTLFLSLPLLGRLSLDEASAVFAHEMAHFSGGDTAHSQRIGGILNRFDHQLRSLNQGFSLPIFHYLLFFRALFELSLGKVSREREFRADRIAAQLVDRTAVATSLAKVSAFCAFRAETESALFRSAKGLSNGRIATSIATGFESFVAKADLDRDIMQSLSSHPFDRHPTFSDRLANIGLDRSILVREVIAAKPSVSWRDAMIDGMGIESTLWAEYEGKFQIAHEEKRAFELRPDNDAEAAIVRKFFPDRVIEGNKGAVLAIDFASISFSEWDGKIAMGDIADLRYEQGLGGEKIVFQVRIATNRKTYELPLKRFKNPQDVVNMIGMYRGRHQEALEYCRIHRTRKQPVDPASTANLMADSDAKDLMATPELVTKESHVRALKEPSDSSAEKEKSPPDTPPKSIEIIPELVVIPTAPHAAAIPIPRTVAAEAGVLNGRYAVTEAVDDWELGQLQSCLDRKTSEEVLCVRIGALSEGPESLLEHIQTVAKQRIPGLITPVSLIRSRNYRARQPGSLLAEGDFVLTLPNHGTQPLLNTRTKANLGSTALANVLRLLRPLAEILDGCHAAKISLAGLEMDHIRVDPEKRVMLFLFSPWVNGRSDGGLSRILDPINSQANNPATIIAALAAMLLAEPSDLHLYVCMNGNHRIIPGIPHAANEVLARQFSGENVLSGANLFLDELQLNFRVKIESYLDRSQITHLRTHCGLDDDGILGVIKETLRSTRPGVQILVDQSPLRIRQGDLNEALARMDKQRLNSQRGALLSKMQLGLIIAGGCLTLMVVLIWWFCNNLSEPTFKKSESGLESGLVRATFTHRYFLSENFPGRSYSHIPASASAVAFYAQAVDLPSGSVEVRVVDDQGNQLGRYAIDVTAKYGWLYVLIPCGGRADLKSMTGQVYFNGKLLLEQTTPVWDSWFDGIGRILLTVAMIWALVIAGLWYAKRVAHEQNNPESIT